MNFITIFHWIQIMEIDYNKIYYQIKHRPSPKSILIAIPFYMYRVITNEFEYSLNFFQKLVLHFKAKPGIKDETISLYTGLDPKLISIVKFQLQQKGLLNEFDSLTENGNKMLREIYRLMINYDKKKIGYVFKYVDQDINYQYFIERVVPAEKIESLKKQPPKIVISTKGDGEDYLETPYFLNDLYENRVTQKPPDASEVLQLIQNSYLKQNQLEYNAEELISQLDIRFLNDKPDTVWVCTYIYLYLNDNETYEPDWRVLDPFNFGDNINLKYYLINSKNLLTIIQNKFADAKLSIGKIFSDFQEKLVKQVEEKLLSDFSSKFYKLDKNLQFYLEAIVKSVILLENCNYNDLDASLSFSLNLQNALENILKKDKENRRNAYELVFSELDKDRAAKRKELYDIYNKNIFSNDTIVPSTLLNVSKTSLSNGKSLLSHLVSFILTYKYDKTSVLFKILRDRIEFFIEISKLRNEKGHGQTSSEKPLRPLTKEEITKYYNFIRLFVNDYIKNL